MNITAILLFLFCSTEWCDWLSDEEKDMDI
jgi:hypothetical protein